ncbi:putative UTP--glucose-1-phosphate uridylyltransferase [groundwater metagenome]|uniref:UTP--glucose-1-phosphate uridylyltransferase n=1 Tax=groundwater metagenome TaxID=717931 RepID=A0A098ED61_9ZZZZ
MKFKGVIPVAGFGTRFLPITKAQPKEMLPVIDKPVIQYVVEEFIDAGIDDILMVTGREKRVLEDHFDKSIGLEMILKEKGKEDTLRQIEKISDINIFYTRQKDRKGLGDAILHAENFVDGNPFIAHVGDTILIAAQNPLKELMEIYNKHKKPIILFERVKKEDVEKYGIIECKKINERLYKIEHLVEKPKKEEAKSDMAVIGVYLFDNKIFDCIKRTKPGAGNEIQITDAINMLLEEEDVYACEFKGKRYDIGNIYLWLTANIEFALKRDDLRDDLIKFIKNLVVLKG